MKRVKSDEEQGPICLASLVRDQKKKGGNEEEAEDDG